MGSGFFRARLVLAHTLSVREEHLDCKLTCELFQASKAERIKVRLEALVKKVVARHSIRRSGGK